MPTASITIRVGSPGWPGSTSVAGRAVAATSSVGAAVAACAGVSVGSPIGAVGSARNSSAVGAVAAASVGAVAATAAVGALVAAGAVVAAGARVGAMAGCSGAAAPPHALSSSVIRMIIQRCCRISSLSMLGSFVRVFPGAARPICLLIGQHNYTIGCACEAVINFAVFRDF
jgi:hypothetical protein